MNLTLITLKVTRYSDTQSILSGFSREWGRVSLALPAGSGKSAIRMRALTMPFGIVECVTERRPGREILPIRQVRQLLPLTSLHSNPLKQMVAMFLSEVLAAVLQDTQGDEHLFDFIAESIRLLDTADGRATANFHIYFLYHLGRMLGIEPDTSTHASGYILDLADGIWRPSIPLHRRFLPPAESSAAFMLSRMTSRNLNAYRYTREERNRILDQLLEYFSIHYVSLRGLHSLDILRSML